MTAPSMLPGVPRVTSTHQTGQGLPVGGQSWPPLLKLLLVLQCRTQKEPRSKAADKSARPTPRCATVTIVAANSYRFQERGADMAKSKVKPTAKKRKSAKPGRRKTAGSKSASHK